MGKVLVMEYVGRAADSILTDCFSVPAGQRVKESLGHRTAEPPRYESILAATEHDVAPRAISHEET